MPCQWHEIRVYTNDVFYAVSTGVHTAGGRCWLVFLQLIAWLEQPIFMHLAVAWPMVRRRRFSTPSHGRSITPSNRCTAAIMQLRTWGSPTPWFPWNTADYRASGKALYKPIVGATDFLVWIFNFQTRGFVFCLFMAPKTLFLRCFPSRQICFLCDAHHKIATCHRFTTPVKH